MDDNRFNRFPKKDEEQPQNGLPLRRVGGRSPWQYKRLWAVVLLFCLFGGVGGLVPSGKIPFFSYLVQAMGFSEREAQEMPLLKALLKWHQKYRTGKADTLSDAEIAANERASAERNLALSAYEMEKNKQNLESLLISMRQVNKEQRSKGRKTDNVRGAVRRTAGDETENEGVNLISLKNFVGTDPNSSQQGEFLFGQEDGLILRDEKDGFNTTHLLGKIKNPYIAGSTSSDWFVDTVDKARLSDADLGRIAREMDTLSHAVDLGDIKNIGKDRPHRDLSYAWLMGKTTYRTSNVLLKKTLAAAGFNGEDIPKKVFDSSLTGHGVGIDPNEVSWDAQSMRERLEKEENCQIKLLTGGQQKITMYEDIRDTVKQVGASFPSTCADILEAGVEKNFQAGLRRISNKCRDMNKNYADLWSSCNVVFTVGKCPDLSGSYARNFATFKDACDKAYKKCLSETDANGTPNTPAICAARRKVQTGKDVCKDANMCDKETVENDMRYRITGYGGDETSVFTQSSDAKQKENGANETDYLPSQNVQDIVDTLAKMNKGKKKTP